eukprot:431873_1
MDSFPVATQKDLVLTSSVNWSSDTTQIIENDGKEFEENNILSIASKPAIIDDTIPPHSNVDHLDMSWGNYFAQKSPPMGDLSGSHGIFARPQLFHDEKQSELVSEKAKANPNAKDKQEKNEKNEQQLMATILEDDMENEDVMINIDESLENINLSDYLSRDSNSTNQSTDSTNSTVIQMPTLKYTQRLYQFEVSKEQINDASQREIEAKIEQIILNYIESQNTIKAHVSATTYNPHNNRCTVLILFDTKDDQEWINTFLSFPQIKTLIDQSQNPYFTQISQN